LSGSVEPAGPPRKLPTGPAATPSPGQKNFESLLVAGAVIAGALSTGWPDNPLQWVLLVTAAVLGGLAPRGPLRMRVRNSTLLKKLRPKELRRPLVFVVVALIAAALGRLVLLSPSVTAWASARLFGCPNPTELRLLATPEGLTTAQELADRFEAQEARANHGCAPARLYVYARSPGTAQAALASGWSANNLRSLGPRPDLWLPGSQRYPLINPVQTSNGLLLGARTALLATTPLVLAVPAQAMPPILGARRTDLRWTEALSALDRPEWSLVRPDPVLTVVGELGTLAIYASDGGRPERLADPEAAGGLLDLARARAIENRIARGLDAHGYPLGDTVDLLCRHRQLTSTPTALIVTEQHVVRFNAGRPLGGSCPEATTAPAPGDRLIAVYPVDTLALDYPLITLEWPDRSDPQRRWTGRFGAWLADEAGRAALNDVGLRPPARSVGHPLTEALGALSGISYPRVALAPGVVERANRVHAEAERPGRVLLALDASGSMQRPVSRGTTRFAVAAAAVTRSLGLVSDRDEFGLWVFQGSGRAPRQLVSVGPGGAAVNGVPRRDATVRALGAVRPSGNTPLYRAIVDATAALGPADPGRIDAVVVLTDGVDYGSGITAAAMVNAVRGTGVRVFVVAIGEASCGAPALEEVTRLSAGGCVQASPGDLDAELRRLFRLLWGGS
jgi:Ca-activated chloride channel homolog